jgi:hypothetical protein
LTRQAGSAAYRLGMRTHPVLAGLPQFWLALAAAAVGTVAGIRWPWVVAVAGSLVVVGLAQILRAAVELGRRRRLADEWLLWGAVARPSSPLLDWRAAELSSPRLRTTLAHTLQRIERQVSGSTLPGPVPLNVRAIRCDLALLRAVRERLADTSQPVSVRGVLLVDRLVTEPVSPLYSRVPAEVLAEALSDAVTALRATAAG